MAFLRACFRNHISTTFFYYLKSTETIHDKEVNLVRKALLIIAIVILVLTPVAAYAIMTYSPARNDVGLPGYRRELTQQQEADLQESFQQMIDLKKETINKMVQDGLLTEEQGQQALEQLDDMAAYHAENGYAAGFGMMGYGCARFDADGDLNGRGSYGPGMTRGYNSDYGYYGGGMMRGYDWN
ncbi:MAG: hypothetical protein C0413_03980 [Clostridiales bacterium]|nr:hypothetical protein [Clostridiales bacterium]